MDLPTIGGRCEAYGCGAFDFLPIKCNGCQKYFCKHHVILDSHACISLPTHQNVETLKDRKESDGHRGQRCAFDGCQKLNLESVIVDTTEPAHRIVAVCPYCSLAYCAIHRHSSDHACTMIPSSSTPPQRNPEAHELLSKHFPAKNPALTSHTPFKPPVRPTDPKKIARLRAVELMKMRHHALPADPKDRSTSVPLSERLHLKITFATDNSSSSIDEKIVWIRKTLGTGRALDMLAAQFSIRISDTKAVYLDKLLSDDGTPVRLRNELLLSDQVNDGDRLCLSTGPRAV